MTHKIHHDVCVRPISGQLPLILVLLTQLLCSKVACGDEGRRIALLVGCERYQHEALSPLRYCADDCIRLDAFLTNQGFQCRLLTDDADQRRSIRPTRRNIDRELDRILENVSRDDLILVVLTGHGLQPLGSNQPYFCPLDANPTLIAEDGSQRQIPKFPDSMMGIGDLLERLSESGIGRKLILVDACRDAPGQSVSKAVGIRNLGLELLPANSGVLLSCSFGEFSFESDALRGTGSGAFLHHVLEGLEGAAANSRGEVTWDRLVGHVKETVQETVPRLTGEFQQTPHSLSNIAGSAILARKQGPSSVSTLVAAAPPRHPIAVNSIREIDRLVRTPAVQRTTTRTSTPEQVRTSNSRELSWPFNAVDARAAQIHWAGRAGTRIIERNSAGIDMVVIPPGAFVMGSDLAERDHGRDEQQVRVTLSGPLWMARTEVTQRQWRDVMETEPWKGMAGVRTGDDLPAMFINWGEAHEFCRRLTIREGVTYRLPTEAEWEWACRAGSATRFAFGNDDSLLNQHGWWGGVFGDGNSKQEPFAHAVAGKSENAFGLFDMHGNVAEWCEDEPTDQPRGGIDPLGTANEHGRRAIRGGSWLSSAAYCRSAFRMDLTSDTRSFFLGFRPVSSRPPRSH